MNKEVILDASALLAMLHQEPGHLQVEQALPHALMSSVNSSEVMTILMSRGMMETDAKNIATEMIKEIVPFDAEQAYMAALLRKDTQQYGLSFGDRACLSLAKSRGLSALTADKIWQKLTIPGLKIQLIR